MKSLLSRKPLVGSGLGVLIAGLAVAPAQANTQGYRNTSQCGAQELSQPFGYANDNNYYATPNGESPDRFGGEGWQLSGGAKIVTTTLADRSVGQVLDLPSGSKAVSPVMCVTSEYPVARGIVRNVKGSEGVFFYVEYEGTNTWGNPKNTGQVHGNQNEFTLVTPVNMQPENIFGWQPMRITLIPGGSTSNFEVYDLFVDPRLRG
jgi:hypothetical protein